MFFCSGKFVKKDEVGQEHAKLYLYELFIEYN